MMREGKGGEGEAGLHKTGKKSLIYDNNLRCEYRDGVLSQVFAEEIQFIRLLRRED